MKEQNIDNLKNKLYQAYTGKHYLHMIFSKSIR